MAQLSIKTRVVTVASAGTFQIAPANPGRSYLGIVVIGTGNVNYSADPTQPPAADEGWPLDAAPAAGRKGGSYLWETGMVPNAEIRGWAGAATKLIVFEG